MLLQGGSGLLQGGSTNTLQGGSGSRVQSTSPLTLVQPAVSGLSLNVPSSVGGGGSAPSPYRAPSAPAPVGDGGAAARAAAAAAAQAAAEAAARAAQVNSLRGDIGGIINNIKGTYDSIFGTASNTANEQNQQLTQNYGKSVTDVTDQANTGEQQAGAAYTARGAGDSSYASNAVDQIKTAAQKQVSALGDELKANQSQVGQFVSQQEATRNAQKQGLDSILQRISESNDPNELTSLRNTLTTRLADLQSSSADVQSNKQYLSKLTSVSPITERLSALNTVIGNITKGSASPGLKQAIGMSFIQNSGLDDETQKQLITQLNDAIGQQTQQTITPQSANVPAQ